MPREKRLEIRVNPNTWNTGKYGCKNRILAVNRTQSMRFKMLRVAFFEILKKLKFYSFNAQKMFLFACNITHKVKDIGSCTLYQIVDIHIFNQIAVTCKRLLDRTNFSGWDAFQLILNQFIAYE